MTIIVGSQLQRLVTQLTPGTTAIWSKPLSVLKVVSRTDTTTTVLLQASEGNAKYQVTVDSANPEYRSVA